MVATYFSSFLAAITIGHEQRNLIETFSSNVSLKAEARAVYQTMPFVHRLA